MNANIPNTYKVFKGKKFFSGKSLLLRTVTEDDIELIRIWRNSQTKILRQKELISKSKQSKLLQKKCLE